MANKKIGLVNIFQLCMAVIFIIYFVIIGFVTHPLYLIFFGIPLLLCGLFNVAQVLFRKKQIRPIVSTILKVGKLVLTSIVLLLVGAFMINAALFIDIPRCRMLNGTYITTLSFLPMLILNIILFIFEIKSKEEKNK